MSERSFSSKEFSNALYAGLLLAFILFGVTLTSYHLTLPHIIQEPTDTIVHESREVLISRAHNAFYDVALHAEAAYVYDLKNGIVLYQKNANAQLPLASLTKLLTAYAVLATLSPEAPITFERGVAPTKELPNGLPVGTTLTVADAVELTLVGSINSVAEALGEEAERIRSKKDQVASVVESLSLSQTYAKNSSGLDLSASDSGGYGSAKDMATLALALYGKAPAYVDGTTHTEYSVTDFKGAQHVVTNTNPYVETIPGLLLSKTGFTDLAGGNLAIVFDAGIGHPVAIVVMGATKETRFEDVRTLVERARDFFTVY